LQAFFIAVKERKNFRETSFYLSCDGAETADKVMADMIFTLLESNVNVTS
jgi:hypothetical protein